MRRRPYGSRAMLDAKRTRRGWTFRCITCSRGHMPKGSMQQHLTGKMHEYSIEAATVHMEAAQWVTERTSR